MFEKDKSYWFVSQMYHANITIYKWHTIIGKKYYNLCFCIIFPLSIEHTSCPFISGTVFAPTFQKYTWRALNTLAI